MCKGLGLAYYAEPGRVGRLVEECRVDCKEQSRSGGGVEGNEREGDGISSNALVERLASPMKALETH